MLICSKHIARKTDSNSKLTGWKHEAFVMGGWNWHNVKKAVILLLLNTCIWSSKSYNLIVYNTCKAIVLRDECLLL